MTEDDCSVEEEDEERARDEVFLSEGIFINKQKDGLMLFIQ